VAPVRLMGRATLLPILSYVMAYLKDLLIAHYKHYQRTDKLEELRDRGIGKGHITLVERLKPQPLLQ